MMTYGISQADAYGECTLVQYQEYISLCNKTVMHNWAFNNQVCAL